MSQLTEEEVIFLEKFEMLEDYELRSMTWEERDKYNEGYRLYKVLERKREGVSIEEYMESRKEEFQNNIKNIIRR